jgi:hypothetical protein
MVTVPKVLKKRGRKPKIKSDSVASIVDSLQSSQRVNSADKENCIPIPRNGVTRGRGRPLGAKNKPKLLML